MSYSMKPRTTFLTCGLLACSLLAACGTGAAGPTPVASGEAAGAPATASTTQDGPATVTAPTRLRPGVMKERPHRRRPSRASGPYAAR